MADGGAIRVALDPATSGAARLAVWRDVMRLVGDIQVPDPEALAGEFVSRELGDMLTVRVACTTWSVKRDRDLAAARMPREHVIVNLVEEGAMRGRVADRRVDLGPGDVLLSRATSRLDLTLEDATWLGLLIPRVAFERRVRWQGRHDGCVLRAGSVSAAMLAGLLRSLCALPGPLPQREVARAADCSLALLLACLGEAAPAPRERADAAEGLAKSIRRFIVRRLSDPALTIELICGEFGVSRSALHRLMGESGDVATVIRRLRLQAAARDLGAGGVEAGSLAAHGRRWGFSDERTFRRAFAREFGRTPSALRREGAADTLPGPVSTDLQRWFLGL